MTGPTTVEWPSHCDLCEEYTSTPERCSNCGLIPYLSKKRFRKTSSLARPVTWNEAAGCSQSSSAAESSRQSSG